MQFIGDRLFYKLTRLTHTCSGWKHWKVEKCYGTKDCTYLHGVPQASKPVVEMFQKAGISEHELC